MNETIDRTLTRLENIRSVEPILGALRTISMGRWKAALNRRSFVLDYNRRLSRVAAQILPLVRGMKLPGPVNVRLSDRAKVVALVVGSERGLCGAFNRNLAERVRRYLDECKKRGEKVELAAAGGMTVRHLNRMDIKPDSTPAFASAGLPTFEMAHKLSQSWLSAYEAYRLQRVDILYNAYQGAGRFETKVVRLIPPDVLSIEDDAFEVSGQWPEPIIETPAPALLVRIFTQQIASTCYVCLLESAAAENAARYQLLEDARQNIDCLVGELEAEAAQARRQAITREVQNLAVGAGLLQGESMIQ